MEPTPYLRAFRRRWWVILICVLISTSAALALAPGQTKHSAVRSDHYEATTILLDKGHRAAGFASLNTLAYIATLRPVATLAAKQLHYQGDPTTLTSNVVVAPQPQGGILTIAGYGATPGASAKLSRAFTSSLLSYLTHQQRAESAPTISSLTEEIAAAAKAAPSTTTKKGHGSHSGSALAGLQKALSDARAKAAKPLGLIILQQPVGEHVSGADLAKQATVAAKKSSKGGKGGTSASTKLFASKKIRLLVGLLFGLALGCILALTLERTDSRLRTSRAIERATGLPLAGEVPKLSRGARSGVVVDSDPLSAAADSFRLVTAGVSSLIRPAAEARGNGKTRSTMILLTSADDGEGKTLVASNLAATYAEAGSTVLVISCDLRSPGIHERFGVDPEPGLVQALESEAEATDALMNVRQRVGRRDDVAAARSEPLPEPEAPAQRSEVDSLLGFEVARTPGTVRTVEAAPEPAVVLEEVKQTATTERLMVVASGGLPSRPAEMLASQRMKDLLLGARTLADVIVLDTSALLTGSDAVPLLEQVDAVIVVARPNHLRYPSAQTLGDLLRRLRVANASVVVNGSTEPSPPVAITPSSQPQEPTTADLIAP